MTVHYDRPVRELLADCVRDLPARFTRQDVLTWFARHYPLVKATTISTHLAGLAEGTRPHANLAQYPPLVRRVDHGLYEPTAHALGRGARPPSRSGDELRTPAVATAVRRPRQADVILVGCVKTKRPSPAPARDLYTSTLFTRRRDYAETTGCPWYVLSARHGLVAPDEVIAPYDVHLASQRSSYRSAWGTFVVEQLRQERGSLMGLVVQVHAGDAYVEAVRGPLEAAGAMVTDPVQARSMGETLAWYGARAPYAAGGEGGEQEGPEGDRVAAAVEVLSDVERAVSVPDLLASDRAGLESPGLYSWWVDEPGAADLSAGLGQPLAPGLVYAGQAGATRARSGRRSSNTLWTRLARMHARGRAESSTFRRTLAAVLTQPLGLGHEDDPRLDDWIDEHLSVVALPVTDPDTLAGLEDGVLDQLDPPLNLQGMPPTPVRTRLSQLRRAGQEKDYDPGL